jgi:nitrogen fixation protein FixH
MNMPGNTILTGRHVLIAVLAFFGMVIAVNGVFIVLALNSWSGLSTDDAYRRGLTYNETLRQAEIQRALGWQVRTDLAPRADGRVRLSVVFTDRAEAPVEGLTIAGQLRRPSRESDDRPVELTRQGPGRYSTDLDLPLLGQWDLRLRATAPDGNTFILEDRLWLK